MDERGRGRLIQHRSTEPLIVRGLHVPVKVYIYIKNFVTRGPVI